MPNRNAGKHRLLVPVIGAALLVTSACGATQGAEGDAAEHVTIVIAPAMNTAIPNLVIDANTGEEFGLDIERVQAPSGGSSAQMSALLSGSVDFAFMGSNAAIDAIGQGADVQIVAGAGPQLNSLTMAADAAAQAGVTEDSTVEEKLLALEGMQVVAGRPGSAGLATFEALVRDAGLDPNSDLVQVPISDNSAIPAGLREGVYDAAFASLGAGELAVVSGDAIALGSVAAGDFPLLDGFVNGVVVTSRRTVEDRPELVEAVRNSFIAANDLAMNDETAGDTLYEGTLKEMDRDVFVESWPTVVAAAENTDPEFKYTEAAWSKHVELFGGTGEVDYAAMEYEDLVAEAARG